jgi:hypothetical protein
MRTTRSMLTLTAALSVALSIAITTIAHGQARAVAPAASPVAAAAPDDPFALDDALLTGIPIAGWQAQRIVALRRLQLAESAAAEPQIRDAVTAMRRAHDRGDDETADAILAMLRTSAAQVQTWRLATLRALLTPDQIARFDANVDAMTEGDGPSGAATDDRGPRPERP